MFRKNLLIQDLTDNLTALIISSGSEFLKPKFRRLLDILGHLDPDFVETCDSNQKGYKFTSIHADTYNRFAQKVSVLLSLFPSVNIF